MKAPKGCEPEIKKYREQGFTAVQAYQLAWVDWWGDRIYSWGRRFHVACKDCGKGNDFLAHDSARTFIQFHKGHKTSFFSRS